jgi:hypothetical protein
MATSQHYQCYPLPIPSPNFGRGERGEGKSRTSILAIEHLEKVISINLPTA